MTKGLKTFTNKNHENFPYKNLIKLFLSVSFRSSFAYIAAVLLFAWLFFPYIPKNLFFPIIGAHLIYQGIRFYYLNSYKGKELTREEERRFIRQHTTLMLYGSLIWGISCFFVVIYAPDNYEYIMLALIVSMAGGSISTLSALYSTYLAFNLPMIAFLIVSFLYKGGEFHTYVVIILPIFTYVLMSASLELNKTLKKSIDLMELYIKADEELKAINISLEDRVKEEVEDNRRKDQQMLEQSRLAQMGEMISMIAHQWRQPLSAITATTGSMSVHMQLGEHSEKYMEEGIEKINKYTQHLSTTITDFRNFFKPDKEKSLTSLNEVVLGSLHIIGSSLESQGIIVETFLESEEKVFSYPNELKQVVLNLMKNAQDIFAERSLDKSDATKNMEARIWIETQTHDNEVELRIRDNAGGVLQENISYIFDPYFTTKEKQDGTGLGLYMSKMIVEDHCEGRLEVKNQDEGACFVLIIPRS